MARAWKTEVARGGHLLEMVTEEFDTFQVSFFEPFVRSEYHF